MIIFCYNTVVHFRVVEEEGRCNMIRFVGTHCFDLQNARDSSKKPPFERKAGARNRTESDGKWKSGKIIQIYVIRGIPLGQNNPTSRENRMEKTNANVYRLLSAIILFLNTLLHFYFGGKIERLPVLQILEIVDINSQEHVRWVIWIDFSFEVSRSVLEAKLKKTSIFDRSFWMFF